jgi:hypothetical protein
LIRENPCPVIWLRPKAALWQELKDNARHHRAET